jgi:hypothetical protein
MNSNYEPCRQPNRSSRLLVALPLFVLISPWLITIGYVQAKGLAVRRNPLIAGYGVNIVRLGDAGAEPFARHRLEDVGFKYTSASLFYIDLLTWDGTYCLFNKSEREYKPISEPEAAGVLKGKGNKLRIPGSYQNPPGLYIFGTLLLLAATCSFIRSLYGREPAKARNLPKDDLGKRASTICPICFKFQAADVCECGYKFPQTSSTTPDMAKTDISDSDVPFAVAVEEPDDTSKPIETCRSGGSTPYTPQTPLWVWLILGVIGLAVLEFMSLWIINDLIYW